MSRRWTLRLVACALGACAVLAGCSAGNQEARETLPSPSSAAPSEEELPPLGPEDMPMPAEARTQDAAGAEAFVRYYIELINRTSTVMDAQPLRDLSDGCRDCDRIADNVEEDAANGYRYSGGAVTIRSAGSAAVTGLEAQIAFTLDQAPLAVLDAGGVENSDLSSGAYNGLNGGAIAFWNEARSTWLMSTLTLG